MACRISAWSWCCATSMPRNSTAKLGDGRLQVRPRAGGTGGKLPRPFIAAAQLSLAPPVTAVVWLRSAEAGTAGFAWREMGQPDFPPKQVVTFDCPASTTCQEHSVELPAQREVIHVRVLLPATGADIERIEFRDVDGKPLKTWRFSD